MKLVDKCIDVLIDTCLWGHIKAEILINSLYMKLYVIYSLVGYGMISSNYKHKYY